MSLMSSFWNTISETAESAVESVKETASDVAETVAESAESAYDTVSETASDVAETVEDAAESAYDSVSETASDVAETVEDAAESAYDSASETASDVAEAAEAAYDSVSETASDVAEAAEAAYDSVSETASDVAESVEDAAEWAYDAAGDAVEAVGDAAESVYDAAGDAVESVGEGIVEAYEDVKDYLGRDDAAREEVDKLTPDEIQKMPTADRNRLMRDLQEGWFSDEDKETTKKLFSVPYLDPEFEKIDVDNRKKMIDKFKGDPAFKEARDNWETLTEAKRVEIMQKAVDYQAEAYGIPKTTIATYSNDDPTDLGYYRHSDGKLYINGHDAALKDGGFDEAIDTAVHENGHRYQATLIDKLEAGEIKEGDPLYNQAMTFKLNDTQRGFYVQPPGDTPSVDTGDEYFTQPQENHSRITGTAVQQAGIGK